MRISINDISQDMIIDEDVYSDGGSLILSKGLSVSDEENLKNLLKKHNIKRIKVLMLGNMSEAKEESKTSTNFEKINRYEIESFLEGFNDVVYKFEKEIVNEVLSKGTGDLKKLETLLEENINSNISKTTNIFQLLQNLKDSDDLTFIHCNSVALMSHTIGRWMKLSEADLKDLSIASLFFDIGKYKIPKDILMKKDELTEQEFEIIKTHVNESLDMLEAYKLNDNIINAIKFHHERCDGSGYPYGLKGDQIPTMAKIIALADMFVALTSKRPYRPKYTPFQAIRILQSDYAQKIDIVILSEFIKRVASNYLGSKIKLNDGTEGEILFINSTSPLRPIIKIKTTGDLLDLSAKSNSHLKIEDFT